MRTSFHEARSVGLLLTFIGGAMDSYTYIHYDAFASAQTGNIVLAIIQAFDNQWVSVGKKVLSTCFFFIGLLLAKFMIDYFRKKGFHFWRLFIFFYESIIFFLVSLPAINQHPALVTIMIAFTAAIQWVSFDKIDGRAYTNLFTTGNLKGVATNLYDAIKTKDKESIAQFHHYLSVVLAFILGASVTVGLYHLLQERAILLVSLLFLAMGIYESLMLWRFYKKEQYIIK
ncbi:MAG: YoaK family protein [Enterococcus sp.]